MSDPPEEIIQIATEATEAYANNLTQARSVWRATGGVFVVVPADYYLSLRCFTRLGTAASAPTRCRRSSSYSE
jgi:hypothetical protein